MDPNGAARGLETAALVGADRPAGGRCGTCLMPPRCVPRLPGGPLRLMRWVIIIEIWYKSNA